MKELGMHHVTAKFVPRILTADQKQQSADMCTELRQLASNNETFLSLIWHPKMKLKLKGSWFDTIEEIQAELQRVLDTRTQKGFQEAFQNCRR
jgi:hypothetical protein